MVCENLAKIGEFVISIETRQGIEFGCSRFARKQSN